MISTGETPPRGGRRSEPETMTAPRSGRSRDADHLLLIADATSVLAGLGFKKLLLMIIDYATARSLIEISGCAAMPPRTMPIYRRSAKCHFAWRSGAAEEG